MSALHAVAMEAAGYLIGDTAEPYRIEDDKLLRIEERLRSLRGGAELPTALVDLSKLAATLSSSGSKAAASALQAVIADQATALRALRQRCVGASRHEEDALHRFRRFSAAPLAQPPPRTSTLGSARDFRIALMLERQAAEDQRLGPRPRAWPAHRSHRAHH
ncbi:MAG: hypothetical protein U1E65_15620 [Myxococcota bacterium]